MLAFLRMVKVGPLTIGGSSASNREPSSGSSHSRIGFAAVMWVRSDDATVPISDSACALGIVPTRSIG